MHYASEREKIITLSIVSSVYVLIGKWQFEVNIVVFLGKHVVNTCNVLSNARKLGHFDAVDKVLG